MLPADDNILLSYVNMKLRDGYSSLDEFCAEEDIPRAEIEEKLAAIGYAYSKELNAFKAV